MFKKILLICFLTLTICGCSCTKNDKLYLTDKYYNKGEYIDISSEEVNNLKDETYLLFTYNDYCSFSVPCDKVFETVMKKHNIDILSISINDYKETYLFNSVKYAPSVILVKNGKIIAYLDANKDEDIKKYEDSDVFESWLSNYINFNKK